MLMTCLLMATAAAAGAVAAEVTMPVLVIVRGSGGGGGSRSAFSSAAAAASSAFASLGHRPRAGADASFSRESGTGRRRRRMPQGVAVVEGSRDYHYHRCGGVGLASFVGAAAWGVGTPFAPRGTGWHCWRSGLTPSSRIGRGGSGSLPLVQTSLVDEDAGGECCPPPEARFSHSRTGPRRRDGSDADEGDGGSSAGQSVRSSLRRRGLGVIAASSAAAAIGIGGSSALEESSRDAASGHSGIFAATSTSRRASSSSSSSSPNPSESDATASGTGDEEMQPRESECSSTCVDCCCRENRGPVPITRISYMTDVEGDGEYFDRFVELSSVLGFRDVSRSTDGTVAEKTGTKQQRLLRGDPYSSLPDRREVVFLDDPGDVDVDCNVTNTVFVYGGDVWDKGGSDLYVLGQLISLRERYGPDRVHFIMGNRDINKMRISQELGVFSGPSSGNPDPGPGNSVDAEAMILPRHGGVYWLRGTGMMGDPELQDERNGDNGNRVPDTGPERLKWMLRMTMGSPDAFEFRRGELGRIASAASGDEDNDGRSISDEDVVRSYREACGPPDGLLARYLGYAVLIRRIGSVLFLHGSLPLPPEPASWDFGTDDLGYAMPWLSEEERMNTEKKICDPDNWIEALNAFAREQVGSWRNLSHEDLLDGGVWSSEGGYHNATAGGVDGGGSLMQYGMGWTPDGKTNPTVVYSSWLTDAMPVDFVVPGGENSGDSKASVSSTDQPNTVVRKLLCEFLDAAGLQLVVTGHKPHGDLPLPIQLPTTNGATHGPRWIVTGDTSYSGDTKWVDGTRSNLRRGTSSSGRGDVAVSEIVIDQCSTCDRIIRVQSKGVMSDGSTYRSTNLMDDTESSHIGKAVDGDTFIVEGEDSHELPPLGGGDDDDGGVGGQQHGRLWWVKTKLDDGSFVVSTAKGFDVWNTIARKR